MIARVVRILEAFGPDRTTLRPSELARRAGLAPSTSHRIVGELLDEGLLERDSGGELRIGIRLWELTTRGSRALALRQLALPFMVQVQAQVREHTQLSIREGDEVLYLERLSGKGAPSNLARIAGRLPLHASSSGLVFLAAADPAFVDELLARPLAKLAPETITDPSTLRRKLAEVRALGHAIAPGSIEAIATGIAVPIPLGRDRGVGALSLVVPRDRADGAELARVLKQAARGIADAVAARDALGLD